MSKSWVYLGNRLAVLVCFLVILYSCSSSPVKRQMYCYLNPSASINENRSRIEFVIDMTNNTVDRFSSLITIWNDSQTKGVFINSEVVVEDKVPGYLFKTYSSDDYNIHYIFLDVDYDTFDLKLFTEYYGKDSVDGLINIRSAAEVLGILHRAEYICEELIIR